MKTLMRFAVLFQFGSVLTAFSLGLGAGQSLFLEFHSTLDLIIIIALIVLLPLMLLLFSFCTLAFAHVSGFGKPLRDKKLLDDGTYTISTDCNIHLLIDDKGNELIVKGTFPNYCGNYFEKEGDTFLPKDLP